MTTTVYGRLAEFNWRDQKRAPKGEADGGQWVAEGGGASTKGEAFAAPVHNFKAKSGPATAAEVNALRSHLHSLNTSQLKRLAAEHEVPHAGHTKEHLVGELHKKIVAHREAASKPVVYTEGKDARLQAFQATPEEQAKMKADDWRKRVSQSQGGFLPDKPGASAAADEVKAVGAPPGRIIPGSGQGPALATTTNLAPQAAPPVAAGPHVDVDALEKSGDVTKILAAAKQLGINLPKDAEGKLDKLHLLRSIRDKVKAGDGDAPPWRPLKASDAGNMLSARDAQTIPTARGPGRGTELAKPQAGPPPRGQDPRVADTIAYYDEKAKASEKTKREKFRAAAVRRLHSIGHHYEAKRLQAGFIPRTLHPTTAKHLVEVAKEHGVELPQHVHTAASTVTKFRYRPDYHEEPAFAEVPLFPTMLVYGRLVAAFADDDSEGHWITIGATEGEDGKRHGGTPVFIKDGRIVKGAHGLVGKKIDALKEKEPEKEETSKEAKSRFRREQKEAKENSRAAWGKQAKKIGHKPEHLHQLTAEILAHDKAAVDRRKEMLSAARSNLGAHGKAAHLILGHGADWVKGLDEAAETAARNYPDQFRDPTGHREHVSDQLKEHLAAGAPVYMSEDEAYGQALEELSNYPSSPPKEKEYRGRKGKRGAAKAPETTAADNDASGQAFPDDDFIPFSLCGRLVSFAEDEGHWRTIHGAHVFIKGGKIEKGPAHLVGKAPDEVDSGGSVAQRESAVKKLVKNVVGTQPTTKHYAKYKPKAINESAAATEEPAPSLSDFAPPPKTLFGDNSNDKRPSGGGHDTPLRQLSVIQKRGRDWDMPQPAELGSFRIEHKPTGMRVHSAPIGTDFHVKDKTGRKVAGPFKTAQEAAEHVEKQPAAPTAEPEEPDILRPAKPGSGKLFDFSADALSLCGRLVATFADDSEGHWVTIGAHAAKGEGEEEDEEKQLKID